MTLPDVKHIEQYFGPWAMYKAHFDALHNIVNAMDYAVHVAEVHAAKVETPIGQRPKPTDYETVDDAAVIAVSGTMTKHGTSLNSAMPYGTRGLSKAISAAAANKSIKGIVLQFETGGGATHGMTDFVDAINAAKKKKPVIAYVDDFCCSAGYWAASQCSEVIANRGAQVGSIGTYMVIQDLSAQAEAAGVKVHVINAGELKGAGVSGTEITDAQIANFQREVNEINDLFIAGVASGRGMGNEKVSALADGRIHIAAQAKKIGLIDRIGTFNDAIHAVRAAVSQRSAGIKPANKEAKAMNDEVNTAESQPRPATYGEIKAACPGADAEFIGSQCEANATVAQAQSAWMTVQSRRIAESQAAIKAAEQRAAEAEAKAASKANAPGGLAPLADGNFGASDSVGSGNRYADPVAEWNREIAARVAQGVPKPKAFEELGSEMPELRAAYVAAHNAAHPRARAN